MIRNTLHIIFLLFLIHLKAFSQDPAWDPVVKALDESDSRALGACFHSTVDLGFSGNDKTYSKSQAEMIMKDFFQSHPEGSFQVMQQGSTDASSRFAIGLFESGTGNFQVYINLRMDSGKFLIHKMRFEKKTTNPPGR
jgi:hypothetical protein